jgi:hypothetical protein
MTRLRQHIRNAAVAIFRIIGSDVIDQRTGKCVGRAFFFGWKGRVIAIGLENDPPLRAIFLPQERLTYWKQEIGFTSHPLPDFPSTPSASPTSPVSPTSPPPRENL